MFLGEGCSVRGNVVLLVVGQSVVGLLCASTTIQETMMSIPPMPVSVEPIASVAISRLEVRYNTPIARIVIPVRSMVMQVMKSGLDIAFTFWS